MKKQNSISYETSKLFFEGLAGDSGEDSFFIVRGGHEPRKVDLPTLMMHRLFRLGQAYGLRQLCYLESDSKILVGQAEIPEFQKDLQKLLTLVNDEALHQYVRQLAAAIDAPPGPALKNVTISTGSYFAKRG